MRTVVITLLRIPALAMIGIVRLYQWTISPLLGPQCRFTPTCSNYAIGAIQKHGLLRGSWRTFRRICRCHPWHEGGHDPP